MKQLEKTKIVFIDNINFNELGTGSYITFFELFEFTLFIAFIGLGGMIYNYRNYFITMLSIEIMYMGIILSFIIISIFTNDPKGQIYAILILMVAASESAIGLAILVVLYRCGGSIEFKSYTELRG